MKGKKESILYILGGGFGTRLGNLTKHEQKIILPLHGGKKIVEHLLGRITSSIKITKIVFGLGHKAQNVRGLFGNEYNGIKIEYVIDPFPLGTGGAFKYAYLLGALNDEKRVIVHNGDIISTYDYGKGLEAHLNNPGIVTIAATRYREPERMGVMILDKENKILEFIEKPEKPPTNIINAGIYFIEKASEVARRASIPSSLEKDVFPLLAKEGNLYADLQENIYWEDVGTLESFEKVKEDFERGIINWPGSPS